MIREQGESFDAGNSRQFYDIVAPKVTDIHISDRVAMAALRLCDDVNFLRVCEALEVSRFTSIPSAPSDSAPPNDFFAMFPELSGDEGSAETEGVPQLIEQGEREEVDEFDVDNAHLAVSAMMEHLGGEYNLTEKQMRRVLTIARKREARTRLAADDKRILEFITLRKAPPTPYQDRRGK